METIKRKKTFKELATSPIGLACIILFLIVGWIATGMFSGGGEANGTTEDAAGLDEDKLFLVGARNVRAQDYMENVQVRGRTEALKTVDLKAEVPGKIVATPVEKGDHVQAGQTICKIAPNAREAYLAQARAKAAEKELQYKANLELSEKGFRSSTQVAAAKAELDAALAQVRQAELDLEHTSIKAPFSGLVNDRPAEIGDFLQVGSTCAVILTETPYLVVGEVADKDVTKLKPGAPATVELTNGTVLEGTVRYISNAARVETRTFRVEVEVPNEDGSLRDGMTANITIPAGSLKAYFLTPSLMALKDNGVVGIRTVENGTVNFYPIEIIGNEPGGMWVLGLPDEITLITKGQNFVEEGQKVEVSFEGEGE